nr:MAG TPA: hypothetical protein [Caudoviricetes sp.]
MLTTTQRKSINERSIRERWWFWLAIGVIIIGVCAGLLGAFLAGVQDTTTAAGPTETVAPSTSLTPEDFKVLLRAPVDIANNDNMTSACLMKIDEELPNAGKIEFIAPPIFQPLGGSDTALFQTNGSFRYQADGVWNHKSCICYITTKKGVIIDSSVITFQGGNTQ